MAIMEKINRRQFIITENHYHVDGFLQKRLENGYWLSWDSELHIVENGPYILLGRAFSCTEEKKVIPDVDSLQQMRNWAGRWVLIYEDRIYTDICGTLGCYYGYSKTGEFAVSSSLGLVADFAEAEWTADYQIKYGDGNGLIDYYPIPETPYSGIKKLFATQFICLQHTNKILPRTDYIRHSYLSVPIDQLEDQFIRGIRTEMKNISAEFGDEVWVTLTGGVDSRSVFAAAVDSGIPFHSYTVHRTNTRTADIERPKKISAMYKIPHLELDIRNPEKNNSAEIFDIHCAGDRKKGALVVGTERQQYLAGVDVPVKNKAIVLWGTVWEASSRNYWNMLNPADDVQGRLRSISDLTGTIVMDSTFHERTLRAWLSYIEQNPMDSMNWKERFYYEERVGAWVSAAQQAYDLFDSERIAPINCQALFEMLRCMVIRSFAEDEHSDKRYQLQMIEKCCPELKKIPYGEEVRFSTRVTRKIRKILHLNKN